MVKMVKCNYGNCENESTTQGHVLARNPDGGKDIPTLVYACDKHKKLSSFFEAPRIPTRPGVNGRELTK
jgi:hypothetical protein